MPSGFRNIEEVAFELIKHYNIPLIFNRDIGKVVKELGDFCGKLCEFDYEKFDAERSIACDGVISDKEKCIDVNYKRIIFQNGTIYQEAGFKKHDENKHSESITIENLSVIKKIELTYAGSSEDYLQRFLELPKHIEYGSSFSFFLEEMNKCALDMKNKSPTADEIPITLLFFPMRKHEIRKIIKYVLE